MNKYLSLPHAVAVLGQGTGQCLWLLATRQIRSRYQRETNTLWIEQESLEEWCGFPLKAAVGDRDNVDNCPQLNGDDIDSLEDTDGDGLAEKDWDPHLGCGGQPWVRVA